MNLTLITHAIAALTAAGAVWVFQDARWAADVADTRLSQADEQSAAVSRARAEERAINKTYQEALNAARTRETSLRRDIDAARTESDSLREQLSYAARLIADAPPPPSLSTPLPSVSYSLSAAESERSSQKKLTGTRLMSEPSLKPGR
jgi:septal ring factor EnvC (AmiA/AmiB activator)